MSQPPYPAARPPFTLTLGDALLGGGGALIFLFSFAPFLSTKFDVPGTREESYSAWATELFMAPLTWWVIFAGIFMVVLALTRSVWAPQREFYGFKSSHVQVGLALFAFFVLIGYGLSDKTAVLKFGWGGVIMTLASIASVAGAIMNHLGIGPTLLPKAPRQVGYAAPSPYPPPPTGPQD